MNSNYWMVDDSAIRLDRSVVTDPKPVQAAKVDGRTLRSERTRERIVGAALDLIREGEAQPRTAVIADRAGVSVRSIFQHFADTEALFIAVADRVVRDVLKLARAIPESASLDDRVGALLEQRAEICETLMPLLRSAAIHQSGSASLAERARAGRMYARFRSEQVLRPELDRLPPTVRQETLDALTAAMDWETWANLRLQYGLESRGAASVMRRMLVSILGHALAEAGTARAAD